MDHSPPALLRAMRCEPVDRTPVWFMRQAGRSLPEYRALRGEGSILEATSNAELSAELTLQPVRRYGVDAAVLFSDIVVPLVAVGVGIDVEPGRGPVLDRPFSGEEDVDRLRPLEPEADLSSMLEAIQIVLHETNVPLIGFAGAPFTLASYLVEGGSTRTFGRTKRLMHAEPRAWHRLLDAIAGISLASLRAQVRAGASAVQLFDSWAGVLSRAEYEEYALPASRMILEGLADLEVPRIHFGVGTGELLAPMAAAGADVLGVDWRVPLDLAASRASGSAPGKLALQGNLDPTICLAPASVALEAADSVLDTARDLPGHVFNLGHGVLPETDPGVLKAIVDHVHERTGST